MLDATTEYALLQRGQPRWIRSAKRDLLQPRTLLLCAVAAVLLAACRLLLHYSTQSPAAAATWLEAAPSSVLDVPWHGVSLGGWLVMEINPSSRKPDSPVDLRPQWMYDQIEAASELDFVTALRREHGDAYAIQTMKNHACRPGLRTLPARVHACLSHVSPY